MAKKKLLTQKEYADRIGVRPSYVSKLISQGKIVAIGPKRKVDPKQADAARKAFARAGRVIPAKRSANRGTKRPANVKRGDRKPAAAETRTPGEHRPNSSTGKLVASRADREGWEARTAELKYKQLAGDLLPRAGVLVAQQKQNTNIRQSFRRVPRTMAVTLARTNSPAEVEKLLLAEIDAVLSQLAADPLDRDAEVVEQQVNGVQQAAGSAQLAEGATA